MMRCTRPPEPPLLQTHGVAWTERFVKRRRDDANAAFAWPQHEGVALNQRLLPSLVAMTQHHCAYCDHFELGVDGARATIDHFRPKGDARFWHLAYAWSNLFPCCDLRQSAKAERFCELAVAPDDTRYTFVRFFVVRFATGCLEPNPGATPDDQERAREMIAWLGLNDHGRPEARRRAYRHRYAPHLWYADHPPLDELPYRYLCPDAAR